MTSKCPHRLAVREIKIKILKKEAETFSDPNGSVQTTGKHLCPRVNKGLWASQAKSGQHVLDNYMYMYMSVCVCVSVCAE